MSRLTGAALCLIGILLTLLGLGAAYATSVDLGFGRSPWFFIVGSAAVGVVGVVLTFFGAALGDRPFRVGSEKRHQKPIIVTVMVLAVFGLAVLVAIGLWSLHNFGPAVVRDHAGMAAVKHRLRPVQADLSAVPSPPHTKPASPATFTGCSTDSGEIFQPEVDRVWTLTRDARGTMTSRGEDIVTEAARSAGTEIVRVLIARGWIGRATLGHEYAATTLRAPGAGPRSYLTIQVFYDEILASASTSHDKVCGRIL